MKLIEKGRVVEFRKGQTIYKTEHLVSDQCVYLVTEGQIELSRPYSHNRKEAFVLEKGALFGMLEVVSGGTRFTDAVALDNAQAIGFTKEEFEKNLTGDLSFALLCIRMMSAMLRKINQRIKELG